MTGSPEFDIVIRGGTIVDGSGSEPFVGDVAIGDGVIRAVGVFGGNGREEIAAAGRLVIPGFVDIHTHYDGQVTWENRLRPSSELGVTTVVMGNCGVGFAPCRENEREVLVRVMEGVEDIPEIVLTTGIPWKWTTFPEYLDFLATRAFDADCAAFIPHAALRVYVMGERAERREPATAEDRARMTRLVKEAVEAGAVGVSTSRLLSHRDSSGDLAPHVQMAREEMLALADGLRAAGKGIFQLAAALANQTLVSVIPGAAPLTPEEAARHEVELMAEICRRSGRPVSFSLSIINDMPQMARHVLSLVEEANREPGVEITVQVFPRPTGILYGLDLSLHPFRLHPAYKAIEHLPLGERVVSMKQPEVRAAILEGEPDRDHPDPIQRFLVLRALDAFPFAGRPDYEPDPDSSLRAIAAREGRRVEEVAYDVLLADEGQALLFLPINNFPGSLDQLGDMLANDQTLIGLGDGGAHLGLICDASYATFLLSYWVRDRVKGDGHRIALPVAINRLTRRNALAIGMPDRGLIAPGLKADINIIDFERLELAMPRVAFDLPAGGRRITQDVAGIEMTIVAGVPTYRAGQSTKAFPGKLVRIPKGRDIRGSGTGCIA